MSAYERGWRKNQAGIYLMLRLCVFHDSMTQKEFREWGIETMRGYNLYLGKTSKRR